MNVYDFDQTIYESDSSYHFILYCLKKHPWAVLPVIPGAALLALGYKRGWVGVKRLKQQLFSFLPRLRDPDRTVHDFWREHRKNLQPWYLRQKRTDDVIVSASPEFLLRPIAEKLGVRLIATSMDRRSGRIDGENCHGKEKVRRFFEKFPNAEIEAFYSDSLSDTPLAEQAKKAFLVRRGRLGLWPGKKKSA